MSDEARARSAVLTAAEMIARIDAATAGLDTRDRALALDVLLRKPEMERGLAGEGGEEVRVYLGERPTVMRPPAPASSIAAPLDAALYYAASLGWSVFPLHTAQGGRCSCSKSECKQPGKHPRTEHGFKDATQDAEQIQRWWGRWSDAPIGVATGEASGFVVVDVDLGKGGPERLAELEAQHGALPPTPTSRTGGGGSHLLFALPGAPLGDSTSRIAKGVDVRATGGYIVAPPSSHVSGASYAWRTGAEPWALALAPMPLWLFERARAALRPVPDLPPSFQRGDHPLHDRVRRATAYLTHLPPGIAGQEGHDTTFAAALRVTRGFDLPYGVAVELMLQEYNPRCQPPWTREEIEHKVVGAMVPSGENPPPVGYLLDDPKRALPPRAQRLPPIDDSPEAIRAASEVETGEDVQGAYEPILPEEPVASEAEAPSPATVAPTPEPEPLIFVRGDHTEIAAALLTTLGPAPLTHDEGEFWRYQPDTGAWLALPIPQIEHTVTTFAGAQLGTGKKPTLLKVNSTTVKGAAHLARIALLAVPEPVSFAAARRGVAFRNGFAVVTGGKITLTPHDPTNACRFAFPFDYDDKASYDDLSSFFEIVFGDVSEEERADRIALIQEFAGASLIGEAPIYQRCLILFGDGGNGKGEVLRILRGLFPPHAVISLPPQHWGERFQIARLVGALANFVDEIPERDITSGDTFKGVITGDPTHAERKGETPFEFRPVAGNIFNANMLPGSADRSDGFWRRFAVCPFTQKMAELSERRLTAGKAVLASCLPGCVRWALLGAAKAQEQGGYTISEKSREIVEKWRDENDPVRLFLRGRLDADWIGATLLYQEFIGWTRQNGHAQMSSTKFGRSMTSIGLYEKHDFGEGRRYRRKIKASVPAAKTAG